MRELLPASTVFVFQDDEVIKGFIGISDNSHIAGLFISQIYQSLGIGQQLLDYCKQMFATLTLDVFCKNVRAIQFYRRNGFEIVSQNVSDIFSEMEYHMEWCKPEIKKKNM